MKFLWIAALLFALSFPLRAQDIRRDGNWWVAQSDSTKLSYVLGFYDGMNLGVDFSYWKYQDDTAYFGKVTKSFEFYNEKFFKDVTNGQLAEGLDVFYKDYRNRKILVHSAVWLTVNSIAGTPQKDLDKMVENFRKNAD